MDRIPFNLKHCTGIKWRSFLANYLFISLSMASVSFGKDLRRKWYSRISTKTPIAQLVEFVIIMWVFSSGEHLCPLAIVLFMIHVRNGSTYKPTSVKILCDCADGYSQSCSRQMMTRTGLYRTTIHCSSSSMHSDPSSLQYWLVNYSQNLKIFTTKTEFKKWWIQISFIVFLELLVC